MSDSAITIYHNPACGTSRNTLALIRNSGVEPTVIHYLEAPPSRETLGPSLPVWGRGNARADKNRGSGRRQGQARAQNRRRGACWQPGGRQESPRFFPCIYTGKQEGPLQRMGPRVYPAQAYGSTMGPATVRAASSPRSTRTISRANSMALPGPWLVIRRWASSVTTRAVLSCAVGRRA